MLGCKKRMKGDLCMDNLQLQRGDIIRYEDNSAYRYGVNVQNETGNKYSPTIIVAEIELVNISGSSNQQLVLETYPNESLKMVVNLEKIRTIDKQRTKGAEATLPQKLIEELDRLLRNTFNFEEKQLAQVVFVDLGRNTIGSEQGGERPAIVLKGFKNKETQKKNYLVAVMTSKMSKRQIPTHVMYEMGEAGILRDSLCLFEQLKYVDEEDVLTYHEYTPQKKIPNVKKAFDISLGIKNLVRSEA